MIFRMVNFYDGPKPYYVGANINEINEYGVYYFEENAPSYADPSYYPERIKTEIKYIGGEDPEHNRTIVVIDYFERYYQGYWNETKSLPLFSMESNFIFLYENYSAKPIPLFADMVVKANVNWTLYTKNSGFTPLINGYKITPPTYVINIEYSFSYTNKGVLDIFSVFYNG
ncbi:hypothetical protein LCGC14_2971290, partial [marine sediment metagenome]